MFSVKILLFLSLYYQAYAQLPARPLETYNVDPNSLTVSGISSGGAMSAALHFIFSSEVKGAGIFAGAPYQCALNLVDAFLCLVTPELLNIQRLVNYTNIYYASGLIDNPENIVDSRVYIFHGALDDVVRIGTGKKLKEQYDYYGAEVHAEFELPAGHGFPVDGNGYGGPCDGHDPAYDYINECGYSGAFHLLKWLYGDNIMQPNRTFVADGDLLVFDQREFIVNPPNASMGDDGLIYVPTYCKDKRNTCRLHVALHGCNSNMEMIGNALAIKSQFMEVAELNNIIIVFPQTKLEEWNEAGCYDFFGTTGENFATRLGAQPATIRNIWRRVIGLN